MTQVSTGRRNSLRLVLPVVLVVVAGVGLVIGLGVLGGDTAAGPALDENVSTRLASLDGLVATRETVVSRGTGTTRTVERVTHRPRTGATRALVRSGPGTVDVRVSNGSVLWLYDRETETVTRIGLDGRSDRGSRIFDRVERLVAQLNRSDDAGEAGTSSQVSPLPVVPAADGRTEAIDGPVGGNRGTYAVSFDGTETVGERRTYVVELRRTGAGGEPVANYTQTLWLDTQWYYPLQRQTAWIQGGNRTVITTTYTNVTFNPGLSSSTFGFEPPSNATVETGDAAEQRRYESVDALRAVANVSVPRPAVPESFALASATRTTGRIDSLGLRYVNATSVVSVAKLDTVVEPTTEGERVTVAGRAATYRDLGPDQTVVWSCDGSQYKISGRGLPNPKETLVEVATSVGCS